MADDPRRKPLPDLAPGATLQALDAAGRLAARLPPLLLAAERVAASVAPGVHGRRRTGMGETFWQYRPYQPGDSAGEIDWRQTAKGERVYIRQTEWEAAQSVWLWRDSSPSMEWRSDERTLPTKRERAELLLLALVSLLVRAGEHVALWATEEPPSRGRATVQRIARTLLDDTLPGHAAPLTEHRGRPLPAFAQMVMFSDFLDPVARTEAFVRARADRRIKGHLVQVLDPAEARMPWRGRVEFRGLEGEGSQLVPRAERVRDEYRHRLDAHVAALRDICRRAGWGYTLHRTDQSPGRALLALHQALAPLGR